MYNIVQQKMKIETKLFIENLLYKLVFIPFFATQLVSKQFGIHFFVFAISANQRREESRQGKSNEGNQNPEIVY